MFLTRAYLKLAKFEDKHGHKEEARQAFESALTDLGKDALIEEFFLSFIDFEIRQKEFERVRTLFQYALDKLPQESQSKIQSSLVSFEKIHGSRENIEKVIYAKRRLFYEKELGADPSNYDTWFDYIRLEEDQGENVRLRELFERAIAVKPEKEEKNYWRRYIFLWIKYAVFEELQAKDFERTEAVFRQALSIIPHEKFTFAKIWVQFAYFFIRRENVNQARKVLGNAIGRCPKPKVRL